MTDWIDDNKGAGVWEFQEQANKWGYLNNKWWSNHEESVEFSEEAGNPIDREIEHIPCGHWHKWGGETEYHYEDYLVPRCCYTTGAISMWNGTPFVAFPMWMDLPPNGILSLIHDFQGRVYVPAEEKLYDVSDEDEWSEIEYDYETKAGPWLKCMMDNEKFFAWVNVDYTEGGSSATRRTTVRVLKDYKLTTTRNLLPANDIEEGEIGGGYGMGNEYRRDLALDPAGHIVVPDYGSNNFAWEFGCVTSHDFGQTWDYHTIARYPNHTTFELEIAECKIDTDGTFFAMIYTNQEPNYYRYLYKSTDHGDSWSYVNRITLTQEPDDENNPALWIDGTDIYIVDDSDKYNYPLLYKSTDHGATFAAPITMQFNKIDGITPRDYSEVAAIAVYTDGGTTTFLAWVISGWYWHAYEQYVYRSTDGSNWTIVLDAGMPDIGTDVWHLAWGDFSMDDRIPGYWCLFAQEMYRIDDNAFLGYWMSRDDGLTWTWYDSIVSYGYDEKAKSRIWIGPGPSPEDEPQVFEPEPEPQL